MTETPKDFEVVFQRLVKVFQPRQITREMCGMYWDLIGPKYPLPVLRDAADYLMRSQKFFPNPAEWLGAAKAVQQARQIDDAVPEDVCDRCSDKGLIRVLYSTGDPFDVAICTCKAARFYRKMGVAAVRFILDDLHLTPDHRVAYLEDFDDELS